MPDLAEGQTVEIRGSAARPYVMKNVGGVYSCTCPAWRNQSLAIDRRTCKHLRHYRGEIAEQQRIGTLPESSPQSVAKLLAPQLLLAHGWNNEQDLTGWWMSEKLDGVRAFWTGEEFLSRQGNRFYAPAWFTVGLPKIPLDGELWLGRKKFQRTVSIVRRQDGGEAWRDILFAIFDAPAVEGPFEERMRVVQQAVLVERAKHASIVDQSICEGLDHVRQRLAQVEALGGEGLMLRQPASHYEAGRSNTLLKVKTFHDAEARVVQHLPGSGRHRGRLGALLVELPNGTQFSVGTGFTDAQRGNPPPIGGQITFRYQELTDDGVPRFPSFVRARTGS
jgi:DNA ligase 1